MRFRLLILVTVLLALNSSSDVFSKDKDRKVYDEGTTLDRQVTFVFLPWKELKKKCAKASPRAVACATLSGFPRYVYMLERPNVCLDELCLKGKHSRRIFVTFIGEKSDACGGGFDLLRKKSPLYMAI